MLGDPVLASPGVCRGGATGATRGTAAGVHATSMVKQCARLTGSTTA